MNFTSASYYFLGWLIGALIMACFGWAPNMTHILIGAFVSCCWGVYKRDKK